MCFHCWTPHGRSVSAKRAPRLPPTRQADPADDPVLFHHEDDLKRPPDPTGVAKLDIHHALLRWLGWSPTGLLALHSC